MERVECVSFFFFFFNHLILIVAAKLVWELDVSKTPSESSPLTPPVKLSIIYYFIYYSLDSMEVHVLYKHLQRVGICYEIGLI